VKPDEAEVVYQGRLIGVTVERWGDHEREIVEHRGAVVIVAVDGEGQVALVRQLREAVRRPLLELPAGTLEPGEEPFQTAKRELQEETGLAGGEWTEVLGFFTTPGFCRERMTLFFAEGVESGEARPDPDERLEQVRWPLAEVASRVNELEDAKTILGLLLYLRRAKVSPL
jgi:ADP-ribose pyrophosphatase